MDNFISSIDIDAFRGIKHLSMRNLSTINVLVGSNNSGKTSVLEAIRFLSVSPDIGKLVKLAFIRAPIRGNAHAYGARAIEYFSTFYNKEIDPESHEQSHYNISIKTDISNHHLSYSSSGSIDTAYSSRGVAQKIFFFSTKMQLDEKKAQYQDYVLNNSGDLIDPEDLITKKTLAVTNRDLFGSIYVHSGISFYYSCSQLLSDGIMNYDKAGLLDAVRSFDQSIRDISIVNDSIYLHNNLSGTLPLFAYGTGLQKAFLLSLILYLHKGDIVLIDEIDNAINMAAFRNIFPWFIQKCNDFKIQAFVTTHSVEALDAILSTESTNSSNDNIRIITLRKTQKTHDTIAKIRTGQEALNDRKNFGMELRI